MVLLGNSPEAYEMTCETVARFDHMLQICATAGHLFPLKRQK